MRPELKATLLLLRDVVGWLCVGALCVMPTGLLLLLLLWLMPADLSATERAGSCVMACLGSFIATLALWFQVLGPRYRKYRVEAEQVLAARERTKAQGGALSHSEYER